VEDWQFPEELARQFQACGIARCLIEPGGERVRDHRGRPPAGRRRGR
jgi:hypothetical protein